MGEVGVDFDLDPSDALIRQTARTFAEHEVRPGARERDVEARFAPDLLARAGELGFMGLCYPEEEGGSGAGTVAYALTAEEIARVDASLALSYVAAVSLGLGALHLWGNAAQKARYMPSAARGRFDPHGAHLARLGGG
jgi:alkylation response protein AidB-like acyl-CoA dehydrogenase